MKCPICKNPTFLVCKVPIEAKRKGKVVPDSLKAFICGLCGHFRAALGNELLEWEKAWEKGGVYTVE